MIAIPAYCPTCKRFFNNGMIGIAAEGPVELRDIGTMCPLGHYAYFLNGSYTVRGRVLHLATASPEALGLLRTIAQQAIRGKISQQEAVEQIAQFDPALSSLLKDNSSQYLPFLALLAYLIVEALKALGSSAPTQTIINHGPTIKNEIVIQQPVAEKRELRPGPRSVYDDYQKHSKRKKRRLRGKERETTRSR